MLRDVVSVIRRVEDVCIVQLAFGLEHLDQALDHLVDGLQRPEACTLVFVVVSNHRIVQKRQVFDPRNASLLFP